MVEEGSKHEAYIFMSLFDQDEKYWRMSLRTDGSSVDDPKRWEKTSPIRQPRIRAPIVTGWKREETLVRPGCEGFAVPEIFDLFMACLVLSNLPLGYRSPWATIYSTGLKLSVSKTPFEAAYSFGGT